MTGDAAYRQYIYRKTSNGARWGADSLYKPWSIPMFRADFPHETSKSVEVSPNLPQVKRFIEMTDGSPFDGQLHISLLRTCHGGQWTMRILEAIVQELKTPSIDLTLSQERTAILPFFTYQLERHKNLADTDFLLLAPYPNYRSQRTS